MRARRVPRPDGTLQLSGSSGDALFGFGGEVGQWYRPLVPFAAVAGENFLLFHARLSRLIPAGKDFSCIAAKFGPELLRERNFFAGCESFDEQGFQTCIGRSSLHLA